MTAFLKAMIVLATASALSFPTNLPQRFNDINTGKEVGGRRRAVTTPTPVPSRPEFKTTDLEYYLTDDGIAYIRPGFKVKVNSVTIPADRKPVIDLLLTDALDQPLDRLGKETPGAISLSFLNAWYNPQTRVYTSYITRNSVVPVGYPNAGRSALQATGENNGTWTMLSEGHYTYKFSNAMPANYDATKTHTIGIYGSRTLTEANNFINKTYYDNEEFDFRPDGATITEKWDKIKDGACLNCHDPETFGFHGGSRRDVKLCVLCHNPQTIDPDTMNSVDMDVMIHKIHAGEHLTKGYVVVGNRQTVHDYSEIVYPQDLRNCTNCHEGRTAAQKPTQSHIWFSYPSRESCGACHDAIDWVSGVGHPAGPATNDDGCPACHIPDSGAEFDASIKGAHVIPTESKQLAGINAQIVSVTNVVAGQKPTITFKLTDDKGAVIDGTKLNTFSPIHAGPTSSYATYFRESGIATGTTPGVFNAANGTTSFTFTNPIPADAKGTWAFSADIYKTNVLKSANGGPDITNVRDAAVNPIHYVALGGGTAEPRRSSVSMALCNNCHDNLALHGGQRLVIEECVMCHHPLKGDAAQRPAGNGEEESVAMARMIHRIHRGHALTQDLTIYGNGRTPHNYNHVGYPGDLRNCNACHINASQQLPAPGDATITKRDFFNPQTPGAAACLGCHDNVDAAAHAYLNITTFGGTKPAEACATCHGPNSEWSVDKSHAR